MKRRQFITQGLFATGGMIMGVDVIRAQAIKEINLQFSDLERTEKFDLIINGAGLHGYYAAIEASKRGMKVLVIDRRTTPGFDIAWKRKLWLKSEGIGFFGKEHFELFFPSGELKETYPAYTNPSKELKHNQPDEELLLFAGSIKKSLLKSLISANIHVMLMTDVCGIVTDNTNLQGVLVATKHGLFTISCKCFLDATENSLFTRNLFNYEYKIEKAGFVLEFFGVTNPQNETVFVDNSFGIADNVVHLHKGKKSTDQQFLEFNFSARSNDLSEIEQDARHLAGLLSKNVSSFLPDSGKAKLINYAAECSVYLTNSKLTGPDMKGYYCCNNSSQPDLSCSSIVAISKGSGSVIDRIQSVPYVKSKNKTQIKHYDGMASFKSGDRITEDGLTLPLYPCFFDKTLNLSTTGTDVLVAGGGTAGATAAIGCGESGANTMVIDYFNDLGGTKTMGGVLSYYLGIKEHPFIRKIEQDILSVKTEFNMSGGAERKYYYFKTIKEHGCRIAGGIIICGAFTKSNRLTGLLICDNGRLKIIEPKITIDATGDGDVAFFAGIKYKHGDSRTGFTQNYSQWDIPAKNNLPSNINRDYDIIDNTKISELQRGLFLSHYESHFYDFYPMLTVRESRLPEGKYTIGVDDVLENRHYKDVIAQAKSDFDPHYTGSSELSRCGFLLPHSNLITSEIPFRSIVPEILEGLLFSGRGISQTHNAMQFTRMSADVSVLGYVTGLIAADIAGKGLKTIEYDVSSIQKKLTGRGYLKFYSREAKTVEALVSELIAGEKEALKKCCLLPKESIVPILLTAFSKDNNVNIAKALAWFSNDSGAPEIISELKILNEKEQSEGALENLSDKYDQDSLYWRINQNIALLAMSGSKRGHEIILNMLASVTSGGKPVTYYADNLYNSNRIDLRLVPLYNRIVNLCFYIERLPDPGFAHGLEVLLMDENISGFKTGDYHKTRWRVYGADLELYIGSSLARCGSKKGLEILIDYLTEIHANLRSYAMKELSNITGKNFGYNREAWLLLLNNLKFPSNVIGIKRGVER